MKEAHDVGVVQEATRLLRSWSGWTALDRQLADVLTKATQSSELLIWVTVALLSRGIREGDVCLDLEQVAGSSLAEISGEEGLDTGGLDWRLPTYAEWRARLQGHVLVATVGNGDCGGTTSPLVTSAFGDALAAAHPLVLVGRRLYLQRYYRHERVLAERLRARLTPVARPLPEVELRRGIEKWFAGCSAEAKRAAHVAATRRLCVITGGPGTGKTSIVVRLMGLLSELSPEQPAPLRLSLLAPTGKAASRLTESIASAKQALTQLSPALSTLPSAATTLHREVAARPRLPNGTLAPLDVELVVLDEVSMVDLAMMRRLLDVAVPVERLILLGDPHQLASVQAGAVLAEICTAGSCPVSANGEASGSFGAHLVELTHSYRFSGEGGIGQLASLTRSGDAARAWTLLSGGDREVAFVDATTESADALIERVLQGYGELLSAATPREALERLGRFRMLCAHRKGRYGVTTWNERVQQRAALWRKRAQAPSFIEPILITVNSRDTSLSNGDLGVLLREPYQPATPTRAWFRIADRLAQFSTSRLPAFEPAYAMSIHKSQGSEVDEVLILLPDAGSPLLTRELLYTAITRARRRCTIVGSRDAFCRAVERRVERRSGLAESLAAASLAAHEQRQS